MSDNCLFCKIARGEIPSAKVAETDDAFAFRDIAPKAPTHILVIPREHVDSLSKASDTAMLGSLLSLAATVARAEGLDQDGYRVVINNGSNGGQTVDHLHLHVLGGRQMTWPPG
jgi:histidine triad (HIT) family protein